MTSSWTEYVSVFIFFKQVVDSLITNLTYKLTSN